MTDETAGPHMVGHVHLKVTDLERSLAFYREVLDLSVTERHGQFAFLAFDERHHDVALQEVPRRGSRGRDGGPGLYHVAFEVSEGRALAAIHERLRERGVRVSPVDHGISKALYFDDPDGIGIEVYLDTRAETGTDLWDGRNQRFDPESLRE